MRTVASPITAGNTGGNPWGDGCIRKDLMDESLGVRGPVHVSKAKETRRMMAMAAGLEMHPPKWGQEHLKTFPPVQDI